MIRRKLVKFYLNYLNYRKHLSLSSKDVVLVEFPKSGVTYFSFLITNYLLLDAGSSQEVNFFNLNGFVQDIHRTPGLDKSISFPKTGLRFIKSHSLLPGIVLPAKIILIRNPLNTLLSFHRHLITQGALSRSIPIDDFVRSSEYGIDAWIKYYERQLSDANPLGQAIMSYESNVADPVEALRTFSHLIGLSHNPEFAQRAAQLADMASMKSSELSTSRYGFAKRSMPFVGSHLSTSNKLIHLSRDIIFAKVRSSSLSKLLSPNILTDIGLC